jgi:ABC-2 type transport system ATP-binding protein
VLKHSVGHDVIVVDTEGVDATALDALRHLDVVDAVSNQDDRLTIATSDSSLALNAVVIALSKTRTRVKNLTLRTPTLDDVFTELTGSRLAVSDVGS